MEQVNEAFVKAMIEDEDPNNPWSRLGYEFGRILYESWSKELSYDDEENNLNVNQNERK